MPRFLVQTIPTKLPELLINLSSQGPKRQQRSTCFSSFAPILFINS
jgi:hypothetical protein